MFNVTDNVNIWVIPTAPDGGDGSVEMPFQTVEQAVERAIPGSRVVMMPGVYEDKVTLKHVQGEEMKPITIMAMPDSKEPIICNAEWYFYEVSDMIISGLTFQKVPHAALTIVGPSERNIVKNCQFDQCGAESECTIFLGGSSGQFNVIEECQFHAFSKQDKNEVALFIAQSQDEEDESIRPSTHTIARYNHFENFGTAIIVGSSDEFMEYTHHLIEENLFQSCLEGVRNKSAATTIKGNIFREIANAIVVKNGDACDIMENRFEKCEVGVNCQWQDTTIFQNCFVDAPITIVIKETGDLPIVLYNNTFVNTAEKQKVLLTVQTPTVVAVADSIFVNASVAVTASTHFKNCVSSKELALEGIKQTEVDTADASQGDYSVEEPLGCLSSAAFTKAIKPIPQADLSGWHEQGEAAGDEPELKGNLDERDLYLQSFLHDDETLEFEDNPLEFDAMSKDQQPLRPIGEDGELEDN